MVLSFISCRGNSVHHSFQRATTAHGSKNMVIRDNVAFNVLGHTYFVEDGAEEYNVFEVGSSPWHVS
jgi:hypothetical protein